MQVWVFNSQLFGSHYLENGNVVDPQKLEAIANWPQPSNPRALKGFLSLTGYYRKFIKEYGGITALLK